ncbi:hypothetical protein Pdw03_1513 [Penicillium digitatum]|uniref:Uncharacterized protein n=3 Tax=Penicillium digitatum TaxID=36651 RepID=K9GUP5_PEND2|nr:hypothetical protein PDIP_40120 [Penicillium digitatum Pd1]EKV15559.1 hypothetical protein PDIP_40120 [Penicillium digitatum Pd1]EKV18328.1 hypothetical protein PDIG_10080 [Penicillium digitatum PHI26]KAG0155464.1 hypothetical protein PDIDSM_1041 [Penicillium digitatum]QQK46615.1 hypothetical protein Pdw03_1513 [Penicillium digitatum]
MKNWDYGKLAIATAAILGILTLGALTYLLVWYVRRRLRARRSRRPESHENDQFDQSAVSLAEDTSRTLDDFLMKDIQPERGSIMFSRSGSPSITIVIDDADDADHCKFPPQPYMAKHGTSGSLSADAHTLTQISTQETDPDDMRSDQTQWSSSRRRSSSTTPRASISSSAIPTSRSSQIWTTTSGSMPSEQTQRSISGQHSSIMTPRASISSSVIPTAGSSQVWTTTSAGAETFSLLSQSSNRSYRPQSPTGLSASRALQVYGRRSNVSGASSRPSSAGALQSVPRVFDEAEAPRMAYSRNIDTIRSTSSMSPVSPVLVDVSAGDDQPQWTAVPPTPFPFGQP